MRCPTCQKNDAQQSISLGVLPCRECQSRQRGLTQGARPTEFTTTEIKSDRKKYKKDIRQPWRGGILSREYLNDHGARGIEATEEDIKNAQNVWPEDEYYS